METESYQKGKKLYIVTTVLLLIGVIALILYHAFDIHIAGHTHTCILNALCHIYCPGCGGTRAIDYLLHGQILKSLASHPVIVYLAALFLSYYIPATYTYVIRRDGKKYYRFHPWTLYVLLAIILGSFILKNLLLVYGHYDFLGDCLPYWQ